jgi:lysophospholipase L1-like esterase
MRLYIEISFDNVISKYTLDYPSQNLIEIPFTDVNKKIIIDHIKINDMECNKYVNTSFQISNSSKILQGVHDIPTSGIYKLHIDDLYLKSHRSNYWHSSPYENDYAFNYEFVNNNCYHHYRDRDRVGFAQSFIPCFGCSNTYGVYQPADAAWPALLREKLNKNFLNLGEGGIGIDGIYNNLKLLYSEHRFDKCVILFPVFERRLIKCKVENLFVRFPSTIYRDDIENAFHFWSDPLLKKTAKKVLQDIADDTENEYSKKILNNLVNFCKKNKITLFASSWDRDVYDELKKHSLVLLPEFPEFDMFNDRASDGQHPHRKHYQFFVNQISTFL